MEQYSEFYDLLLKSIIDKEPEFIDISDVKSYLQKINHPEKDNASYVYDFFRFCKEPICLK